MVSSTVVMRILHCITGLTGDGAQRLLLRLTRGLQDHAVQSVVVNLGPATPLVSDFEAVNVPVLSLGISPTVWDVPGAISLLRRTIHDLEPDVVQGWMYHANVMAFLAKTAGRFRLPLVWNIRRGMDDYRQRSRATRAVIRMSSALSRYVDSIIYCTEVCRSQHEAFGYAPNHGRVMHNGFDTAKFAPSQQARAEARALFGAQEDDVVIGNVGRYDIAKGHRHLLEAFAHLAASVRKVRLVCVGRGMDACNREISDLLARAGIAERVTLLGERGRVERIFPGFDIYCSSSISEGFPNVIAEAMACALPCVVTDVGGSAEIVDQNGILVAPRSSSALAKGLDMCVRLSAAERCEIGERARARVRDVFSLDSMVVNYAHMYRALSTGFETSSRSRIVTGQAISDGYRT
jgi:glycosyltransferase involved in cell wall biosynthesis